MKLKIYQISHPIIKLISSNILSSNTNEIQNEFYYKYIGFLIIYEMLRKNLKIKNIYIKNVTGVDVLQVIDRKVKYVILTNLIETYGIINEIKVVLPDIKILHIEYKDFNLLSHKMSNLNQNYKNTKIFIMEKKTENDKVTYVIDYLKKENNISLENINIGNILSSSVALEKIGRKYPDIKIYTTTIT